MFSSHDPAQALFTAALDILSRREHSSLELQQKLLKKFPDFAAHFDGILLRLQELNYQSDRRFAEAFTRSRTLRGQGPVRIRQELQLRGLDSELIIFALEHAQTDWYALASEQLQRKFHSSINPALPRDQQHKERARRQRFLVYRGFSADMINCAIDSMTCESD